ncbi:hypothetical protein N3K66_009028 [Trichothecium roseum]|uniref:Uncharacterized protein n=1 Tax=Trichothecium roseum TaxID=47278 RepID=A0ACC0UPU8_9HYPO|nr:hypothetical protein N3K66_009028 [Trichothecium roseum]
MVVGFSLQQQQQQEQEPWPHQRLERIDCDVQTSLSDTGAVPRYAGDDGSLKAMMRPSVYGAIELSESESTTSSNEDAFTSTTGNQSPEAFPALFTFISLPTRSRPFAFDSRGSSSPPPQQQPRKRIRHGLDVDGANTAALACKKRRLRMDLITSRLSQPFSQPATHILNREGQKSGDRRFVKMASKLDMARRVAYLHATSVRRFSVMNRLRRRLGFVMSGQGNGVPLHDGLQNGIAQADTGKLDTRGKALWKPENLQASSSLASSSSLVGGVQPGSSGQPSQPHQPRHQAPHPLRISKPAALPMPSADLAASKQRTSPRIHTIRSPEHCPMPSYHEDPEEDSFAFLHVDEDNEDDGDVYSDFGVIFGGGGGGGGDSGQAQDDHSYEEYLDELDGISWVSR